MQRAVAICSSFMSSLHADQSVFPRQALVKGVCTPVCAAPAPARACPAAAPVYGPTLAPRPAPRGCPGGAPGEWRCARRGGNASGGSSGSYQVYDEATYTALLSQRGGCQSISPGVVLCGGLLTSAEALAAVAGGACRHTCEARRPCAGLQPALAPHASAAWAGLSQHEALLHHNSTAVNCVKGSSMECRPPAAWAAPAANKAPALPPGSARRPSAVGDERLTRQRSPPPAPPPRAPPVPANHKYRPAGAQVPVLAAGAAPPPLNVNEVCACAAGSPRGAPNITFTYAGADLRAVHAIGLCMPCLSFFSKQHLTAHTTRPPKLAVIHSTKVVGPDALSERILFMLVTWWLASALRIRDIPCCEGPSFSEPKVAMQTPARRRGRWRSRRTRSTSGRRCASLTPWVMGLSWRPALW